jgi:hypothetical protein
MFTPKGLPFPSRVVRLAKEYDDDETASLCLSIALLAAARRRMRRTSTNVPIPTGGSPTRTCRPGVAGNSFSIRSTWRRRQGRRLRQRSTPTPGNFPKVDEQTQKSRDGDRRRILESELAAEQKNAEQAKRN